jgi:hypothetical protein
VSGVLHRTRPRQSLASHGSCRRRSTFARLRSSGSSCRGCSGPHQRPEPSPDVRQRPPSPQHVEPALCVLGVRLPACGPGSTASAARDPLTPPPSSFSVRPSERLGALPEQPPAAARHRRVYGADAYGRERVDDARGDREARASRGRRCRFSSTVGSRRARRSSVGSTDDRGDPPFTGDGGALPSLSRTGVRGSTLVPAAAPTRPPEGVGVIAPSPTSTR